MASLADEPPKDIGQINYEAFAGRLNWTWNGVRMLPYARLETYEQDAWREGAIQVMQKGWADSQASTGSHGRHGRRG